MNSVRAQPVGRLLQPLTRRADAEVRLFCFPYAGGGISVYRQWDELPGSIDVWGVQPPGREERTLERPCERMSELVDLICARLPGLFDRPYAFFGHSMGAALCWEVTRELVSRGHPEPVRLFLSACPAPQVRGRSDVYLRSDGELIDELRRLGGTPESLLSHQSLMRLLLPTIRADYAVIETAEHRTGEPLAVPITAIGGTEDSNVAPHHLTAWGELTRAGCEVHMLPGGHLFLREMRGRLIRLVGSMIGPTTSSWRMR